MKSNKIILITMSVGSLVGSFVASLFGAGVFSISSALMSFFGGAAGIYIGYKIVNS